MELFSISEMQEADKLAIEAGISGLFLMEQAGLRLASHIESIAKGPCRVCILAGPGNNGGDAFVVARLLNQRAYKIDMFELCLKHKQIEPVKSDAIVMKEKWQHIEGQTQSITNKSELRKSLATSSLLVDGLFGVGLNRNIEEPISSLISEINQSNIQVLAIDVPSGVNGNTGQVMGAAIEAELTCSFHRPKLGHYLYPGKTICGELRIDDIGIPERINTQISPNQHLNSPEIWRESIKQRSQNSHKYHHGSVLVVSGDQTMRGAAVLASNAAVKSGSGLVTIAEKIDELECHPKSYAAIMLAGMPENDTEEHWQSLLSSKKVTAALIGPGSLPNQKTLDSALMLLKCSQRVVLDAGAITAFANKAFGGQQELLSQVKEQPKAILTPHEGEFKKLFPDLDVRNKIEAAREAAKRVNAVIVLKGPDTVIAAPDERILVNANAPSTLATAGTGDVLAGIIVALASASDIPLFEAAAAAVYIHGECANQITSELVADELIDRISKVKHNLISNS